MSIDSAWIFRICLVTTVIVILFADFLGGGANARKSDQIDKRKNNDEKKKGPLYRKTDSYEDDDDDNIDMKILRKRFSERQIREEKKALELVQQRLTDSLRDLCLPKLLCEIAAKPSYLLSEKEKHVLSLLKSTSLSLGADSSSVWHFSSHMGQLMRHTSEDSMGTAPIGCAMLWPSCPYSSDKLMKISTKVRLE